MSRIAIAALALLLSSLFVVGCASAPNQVESDEPRYVLTSAQAAKYVSEEELQRAFEECARKMQRVTGSRIPRDSCQGSAGLFSGAYNQHQEGLNRKAAAGGSQ